MTAFITLSAPAPQQVNAGSRLPVIASFSILGDLVSEVGGDQVDVTTIIGPGVDAHTFEPTPSQVASISDAHLVFEIGLEFEPWLDDLFAASSFDATRIVVSEDVPLLDAEGHHEDRADDQDNGKFDPHIWMSVPNTLIMVQNIRDALVAADPDHEQEYLDNAATYSEALLQLDHEIEAHIATVPEDQRLLVTTHDFLGYYADRYDLTIVGTALGSITTDAADPTALEFAQLIEEVKQSGAKAVFPEYGQNTDLADQIADEAGATVGPALYSDTLGEPGSAEETYIGIMRFNTNAIVSNLA